MAVGKTFPKKGKINFSHNQSSEILKDSPVSSSAKFSLRGILGLGQSVEIGQQAHRLEGWGKELFANINHLKQEEEILLDNRQKELEKRIAELQVEISKLTKATDNLDRQVVKAAQNPIVEVNDYQLNFLDRIKNFIVGFRQNITQASLWLEAFAAKKRKKNYFWSISLNKKKGGQQYMFSDEHSIARSAT